MQEEHPDVGNGLLFFQSSNLQIPNAPIWRGGRLVQRQRNSKQISFICCSETEFAIVIMSSTTSLLPNLSSSGLPKPIIDLIEKPRIDWRSLESLVTADGAVVDIPTLEFCLDTKLKTSLLLQDVIDVFCFRAPGREIKMVVRHLIREIIKRKSKDQMVELIRGIFEWLHAMFPANSRYRFLVACRSLLDTHFAYNDFDKFKRVVWEIFLHLDIPSDDNFFILRLLDVKLEMEKAKVSMDGVSWHSLFFAEDTVEIDQEENTCINHLLAMGDRGRGWGCTTKYCAEDVCRLIKTLAPGLHRPNRHGTLPIHNIFYLTHMRCSRLPEEVILKFTVETLTNLLEAHPEHLLCPSQELDGSTPFHEIVPNLLAVITNTCSSDNASPLLVVREEIAQFIRRIEAILQSQPNGIVDHHGRTPLHYLISCCDENYRLDKTDPLIAGLLASLISPKTARITSNDGQLPLHAALEVGVDLAEELSDAVTLERRHPETMLYPFLITPKQYDDAEIGVENSFLLLRKAPQLIATALTAYTTAHLSTDAHIEAAKLELRVSRLRVLHRHDIDMDRRRLEKYKHEFQEKRNKYHAREDRFLRKAKRLRRSTPANPPLSCRVRFSLPSSG